MRVRAGRVEPDAARTDLDLRPQPHGLVGVAVRVDEALCLVDTRRQSGELRSRAPLGVVEQLAHRLAHRRSPVAVGQAPEPAGAGHVRGDLRPEVAGCLPLRPDLGEDQREDVVDDAPTLDELDRRHDHALLEDLPERADRRRRAAADVDVVREVRHVAEQLAVAPHR